MRHIFIVNPAAGRRDQSDYIKRNVKQWAEAKTRDFEIHITARPKHATEIAARCLKSYAKEELRFYACGGDGTLNEVMKALIGAENAALTHIPIGSGNDFVKSFPGVNFLNWENINGGREYKIDYLESDCGPSINILSVGFDACIAQGMQKYKSVPLLKGQGFYVMSIVEQFFKGLYREYAVEIDGKSYDGKYTIILAANGGYYGGGFMPMPDFDLADGMFDALLIRDVSRFTVMKVISAYKNGKYRELPQYIRHVRGESMRIAPKDGKDLTVNIDGETLESPSVSLHVEKQKLRFFAPVAKEERAIETGG